MKKHITAILSALLLAGLWAAPAGAEFKNRNELSLQAGGMFFEGDADLDTGFVYGARIGHFFTEKLSAEAAIFPGMTKCHGTDVNTLHPSAAALYHFRFGDFLPFVTAGAGMLRYKTEGLDAQNDFAMHWGGGLKWLFDPDWMVRADVNHVIDFDSGTGTHNLMAVLGVSWLFGSAEEAAKVVEKIAPVDSDKDGVPDSKDTCPATPSGVTVAANGCPADTDKDGVADYKDTCPATPSGVTVAANGCPVDTDKDGVADYKDECAATSSGTVVDEKGCPVGTKAMPTDEHWVLKGVNFEVNSDVITPESRAILDEAAEILAPRSSMRVEIQGHTDNTGAAEYNAALSAKRADAVKNYLVGKGIAADRLEAKGYGDTVPTADNATEEGRSANRRIEFKVLSR